MKYFGVLKYLPPRLRSVPLLAAITVGWLTILAGALITYPGPIAGFEPGAIQSIVGFGSMPLFFLGIVALELIGRLLGLSAPPPSAARDDSGNPTGPLLIFFLSLVLNVLVVWGTLKLIGSGARLLGRLLVSGSRAPTGETTNERS